MKEVTAPLLAFCCRKPAAAGITPQLHKGMGTPKKAALKIPDFLLPPRCFSIKPVGTKPFNKPATRNPNRINTAEASSISHEAAMILINPLPILSIALIPFYIAFIHSSLGYVLNHPATIPVHVHHPGNNKRVFLLFWFSQF